MSTEPTRKLPRCYQCDGPAGTSITFQSDTNPRIYICIPCIMQVVNFMRPEQKPKPRRKKQIA